jgi:hypothetical protein
VETRPPGEPNLCLRAIAHRVVGSTHRNSTDHRRC